MLVCQCAAIYRNHNPGCHRQMMKNNNVPGIVKRQVHFKPQDFSEVLKNKGEKQKYIPFQRGKSLFLWNLQISENKYVMVSKG